MKVTAGTISRTIILALALINQALTLSGKQIISIAYDDIYQIVSLIFTIGASISAWWKNNSFTSKAIKADEYLNNLKNNDTNICGGEN